MINFKNLFAGVLSTLVVAASVGEVQAEVKLHPIFTDNMVLQRDKPIPVWGTADPGERINIALMRPVVNAKAVQMLRTTADVNGHWFVKLKPRKADSEGLILGVSSSENQLSIHNIAIGDVYICSGQSNMEWPISASNNAQAEIAAAKFPNIRLLTVPKKIAGTPQKEFASATNWEVCTPETISEFSAVGYFFGRQIHQQTGIPIGLIDASWGGTIAEAWMSRSTLLARADMREATLQTEANFVAKVQENANQPTVLFNGMIAPLLSFSVRGAIWYQGESNADRAAQYQTLFPELIRDWRTQWNAKQDGSEFGFYFVQLANFMARTDQPVQSGWAELREAQTMALSTPRTGMATTIDIGEAGDIHPRNKQDVGKRLALAALAKEYGQKREYSGPMFSRMEAIPNTNRVRISFTHAKGLKASDLPAADSNADLYPDVPLDHWAYTVIYKLIQAGLLEGYPSGQYNGGRAMTRYEFAVAIARLLERLKPEEAGPDGVVGPPVGAQDSKIDAAKLTPELKNALTALEQEFAVELHALGVRDFDGRHQPIVKGFALQDEDGQWYGAQARIEDDTVVAWSSVVTKPKAVRYAWANNPDVNLVNAEGLPAVPFRTDAP